MIASLTSVPAVWWILSLVGLPALLSYVAVGIRPERRLKYARGLEMLMATYALYRAGSFVSFSFAGVLKDHGSTEMTALKDHCLYVSLQNETKTEQLIRVVGREERLRRVFEESATAEKTNFLSDELAASAAETRTLQADLQLLRPEVVSCARRLSLLSASLVEAEAFLVEGRDTFLPHELPHFLVPRFLWFTMSANPTMLKLSGMAARPTLPCRDFGDSLSAKRCIDWASWWPSVNPASLFTDTLPDSLPGPSGVTLLVQAVQICFAVAALLHALVAILSTCRGRLVGTPASLKGHENAVRGLHAAVRMMEWSPLGPLPILPRQAWSALLMRLSLILTIYSLGFVVKAAWASPTEQVVLHSILWLCVCAGPFSLALFVGAPLVAVWACVSAMLKHTDIVDCLVMAEKCRRLDAIHKDVLKQWVRKARSSKAGWDSLVSQDRISDKGLLQLCRGFAQKSYGINLHTEDRRCLLSHVAKRQAVESGLDVAHRLPANIAANPFFPEIEADSEILDYLSNWRLSWGHPGLMAIGVAGIAIVLVATAITLVSS